MTVILQSIGFAADIAPGTRTEIEAELAQAASSPLVESSWLAPTLPRGVNDGDLLWRLRFTEEGAYHEWAASKPVRDALARLSPQAGVRIDAVRYTTEWRSAEMRPMNGGIWRALIFRILDGTSRQQREQFEQELMLMPRYVQSIRNWSLSRVLHVEGRRRWSYVWEQEFDDIAGLEGEYMVHPIHWGLVDGWFDLECPHHIIDPVLIHTVGNIQHSIMA